MVSGHTLFAFMAWATHSGAAAYNVYDVRDYDNGEDFDLGFLNDMDEFYSMLGTSAANWTDIAETEDTVVGRSPNPNDFSLINPRLDCGATTGWSNFFCQLMPEWGVSWQQNLAIIIAYSPVAIGAWFATVGWAIKQGRNLRATWNGAPGQPGPLNPFPDRRRSAFLEENNYPDNSRLHFKVRIPTAGGVSSRGVVEDDIVHDHDVFNEYTYHAADGIIHYDQTIGTFSGDATEHLRKRGLDVEDYGDLNKRTSVYTVVVTSIKHENNFLPIHEADCIGQVVKGYMDRASENHRFSCQPITDNDSPGGWGAGLGVFIHPQHMNYDVPMECC